MMNGTTKHWKNLKLYKTYNGNENFTFREEWKQLYLFDFKKIDGHIVKEYSKKKIQKSVSNSTDLNDLNGKEWTIHGKSVQTFNSPITEKRKLHGAAFPIALAKHFIRIYSKPGDTVFDPFAGVGTTLDAANILQRNSIGIELNRDFIKLFNQGVDLKDGKSNNDFQRIVIQDSALNVCNHIPDETIDFILTSPPYSNLLNKIRENFADKDFIGNNYKNQSRKLARPYSKFKEDLGNLPYEEYLLKMEELFESLFLVAKQGTYNVWVVRDYRDMKNNIPYICLHNDIMRVAQKADWKIWDMIIWDQSNQRKLVRLGGNKARRYYFNIGHSFILVFRKSIIGEKF
ncbi:MAG TPA: site-specific DNA-methyltransferase [Ignavibacteria bacterium]|nr:site-specific DNA-methyltransferase [Ignavibacteria bacterium]HMR41819.1 site-specific DNA-methyltransferase [Ignavibacteria bacterium]